MSTIDILDLPHSSTRPPAHLLLTILSGVTIHPRSWDGTVKKLPPQLSRYAPLASNPGLSKWLTSLVANELRWIEDEDVKERVWEEAGRRLAERCGRAAMPSVTRGFRVEGVDYITITLYEPSMTADNLGLKTWASSFLLAKRLGTSKLPLGSRALELGSGTGLVGIAAAVVLGANVTLTDLPEIVPNLSHNVSLNSSNPHLPPSVGSMSVQVLDWTNQPIAEDEGDKYPLVLAADPLYSPAHPGLLVGVLEEWVRRSREARVVVEFPLRERYEDVREDFWRRMRERGFVGVEEGEEEEEERKGKVRCWWGVYRWREDYLMEEGK
ncbi:putative methyltransferase-domain-containing protein [Terfezia claveryi]|nr:putative methyltransferase-domain-containing protein [Terfezia claveryi]